MYKVFLDTNILAYACDHNSSEKQARAVALINDFKRSGDSYISTQVLQELYATLTKKLRVTVEKAKAILLLYEELHVVTVTVDDINAAVDASIRWQVSIWDALILTSAKKAGCSVVYTEDLSDGQKYGSVRAVNPFASATMG